MADFLKKLLGKKHDSPTAPASAVSPASAPGAYLGDLEKTAILSELFKTPHEKRDAPWIGKFNDAVVDASFRCSNPQCFVGPDGFPYFKLYLPEAGKPFTCYVLRHMTEHFLLANGTGVVVEPDGARPQWVFTYGDIVYLHLNGNLHAPAAKPTDAKGHTVEVIQKAEQVLVGQPSEKLYPQIARTAFRNYLAGLGVTDAKLFLMQRTKEEQVTQEIIFNFSEATAGSKEKAQYLMRAASWFLPRYCPFGAVGPESSLAENFQPL